MSGDTERKFDPTKPVQTRDGRKARIVSTDVLRDDGRVILALITIRPGHETPYVLQSDGRGHSAGEVPYDLVNIPNKKWFNVFRNYGEAFFFVANVPHNSPEDAAKGNPNAVGCVELEID